MKKSCCICEKSVEVKYTQEYRYEKSVDKLFWRMFYGK